MFRQLATLIVYLFKPNTMDNFRSLIKNLPVDAVVSLKPVECETQTSNTYTYYRGKAETVTVYLPNGFDEKGVPIAPITSAIIPVDVLFAIADGIRVSESEIFSTTNVTETKPNEPGYIHPDDLPF